VTRTHFTIFQDQKAKGQGHQAALLTAALTRKAISVGSYSAWESTATLRQLARGGGILWRPPTQLVSSIIFCFLRGLLGKLSRSTRRQQINFRQGSCCYDNNAGRGGGLWSSDYWSKTKILQVPPSMPCSTVQVADGHVEMVDAATPLSIWVA